MLSKSIQFVVAVLAGLVLSVAPVSAAENGIITKDLWIDGYAYQAQLTESQINGVAGSGEDVHYRGHFPEDPDSWVRVSRLGDGWEGLAFVFNRLHTIRSGDARDPVASFSFSHEKAPQCGLDHLHADASITPESLISPAMAQAVTANYDTLCADKVDGACLMLELELAFDLQFQSEFADDYESRAGAIINLVEGFYEAQFGIVFDTLSLTFMGNDLFSTSNDAGALLDDIQAKRGDNQVPFLKSPRSIFHFITGRDFDGGTAGVAYLGTVCSGGGFASGVTNAFSSNATTAVVVAHEIGHNLGAEHDSPENNSCPSGINIMSPSVRNSYDSFSSCSYDYITNKVSSLSSVEQCFNFPADAGIEALTSNVAEVAEGDVYQGYFDVIYQDASQSAERLAVDGSIGEGEGRLEEVTLNGATCTLTSATGFRCAETQASTSLRLLVQATAGASPSINLAQRVALISDSGEVKDIRSGNDSLQTQISVAQVDVSEPDEPTTPPSDSDSGSDSTGSSSSGGSSGGGGGGSVGWFWLLAGLAGVGRLSKRAS